MSSLLHSLATHIRCWSWVVRWMRTTYACWCVLIQCTSHVFCRRRVQNTHGYDMHIDYIHIDYIYDLLHSACMSHRIFECELKDCVQNKIYLRIHVIKHTSINRTHSALPRCHDSRGRSDDNVVLSVDVLIHLLPSFTYINHWRSGTMSDAHRWQQAVAQFWRWWPSGGCWRGGAFVSWRQLRKQEYASQANTPELKKRRQSSKTSFVSPLPQHIKGSIQVREDQFARILLFCGKDRDSLRRLVRGAPREVPLNVLYAGSATHNVVSGQNVRTSKIIANKATPRDQDFWHYLYDLHTKQTFSCTIKLQTCMWYTIS